MCCRQHEIDHLDGKLITDVDRRYTETIIRTKKYGRNERVMIKLPNGETEFMKYKKAQPLLEQGVKYFNVYEKMGKLIFRYTEDYFKKFNREITTKYH